MISPGVITILCHGETFFAPTNIHHVLTAYIESIAVHKLTIEDAFTSASNTSAVNNETDRGPDPRAEDDFASTPEETPVTINVLANDRSGKSDDDDDDDDDDRWRIDPETVDLNPGRDGIQRSYSTAQGIYSVNEEGLVTLVPAQNFFGNSSIKYTVDSEGRETSNRATITVEVTNVNDAPVIKGSTQEALMATAGQPLIITLDNLVVIDPDNPASDISITVLPGEHYEGTGNSVTPDEDFSGTLFVQVQVEDGQASSEVYTLKLQVAEESNERPVITGQNPVTTSEDFPITIVPAHLQVSDPDNTWPQDFTIQVGTGKHYSVTGQTITPQLNYSGMLSAPVTVNDGEKTSKPYSLNVSVTAVNDAPVITGQDAVSTPEDQAVAIELSHLEIDDPDSENFTLSILGGDNYTVSGNRITPAPGFNGRLTVRLFVSDGEANSNIFDFLITVTSVNDAPVITGQREITMEEGASITLSLADVKVSDPDNTFPDDFKLAILTGEHYTFSGTTVTPAPDFAGQLSVSVIVNDGQSNSQPFALLISVTAVNDAPVITGQQTVITSEETARTLQLSDLIVADPDNTYPNGFTLVAFPGTNYTLTGNSVLPTANFSGILVVQVQVNDGFLSSNIFDLKVEVTAVNDKPVITGQVPVETAEDVGFTIQFTHLTVLDPDNTYPAGFTLSVSPGTNYTVNGTTIQPAPNFNGTLNVPVSVNDGSATSDPFSFQIQVGNANDAPQITDQVALATNEEQPVTITLSHLIVVDPDNAYPTGFSLEVSPGTNYTVTGSTITPALDFAGVLTVPLRVNDGVNNSPTFNFQLQVDQINDAPFFDAIANQKVAENSQAGSLNITGISKGPKEDDQQLTFVATSANTAVIENPVIRYDGTGTTASLSYVIKPHTSGVVTLTIVAIDNGSNTPPHVNSYTGSFQVEVLEINTAPTLNAIADMTILEDAEQQNIALAGISAGTGEVQTLTVSVSVSKPELFDLLEVVYTSPQTSGSLRFKTKPNVSGSVKFSVTVTDNGSATAPNVNSITRNFTLVIQPVNDPPAFTSNPVTVAVIQEEYQYTLTATDPDGDKITLSAPAKPAWASLSNASNGQGKLHGKPPAAALGNVNVTLTAKDASSTVEQNFSIYVNARPSLRSLNAATDEDTPFAFPADFFQGGYSDQNQNPIDRVQVTKTPASGRLLLSGIEVKSGEAIPAASLSNLRYHPAENFSGQDFFTWNAFDGYHFSLAPARVNIAVLPVNDPPALILQNDTLRYEVNGEPALLAELAEIEDADDDTLTEAWVRFHPSNYRPQMDILQCDVTGNIRANFDFQKGELRLTGVAPLTEYKTALRSIRYLYQNTVDPILEPKGVVFTLSDGSAESQPTNKMIILQYTFIEFSIPTGFTPNGDKANDTWVIDRPGGRLEEMDDAIISVYNKHGVLVFRTKGFDRPWDGTMNGEPLPADTYFFTIDLQLRNRKTYKGIVTILR